MDLLLYRHWFYRFHYSWIWSLHNKL